MAVETIQTNYDRVTQICEEYTTQIKICDRLSISRNLYKYAILPVCAFIYNIKDILHLFQCTCIADCTLTYSLKDSQCDGKVESGDRNHTNKL